jgi:hypothetical protein
VLVGVRDGDGSLLDQGIEEAVYFPVARGRVDWLQAGELSAHAGASSFGEALLVELRSLPDAPGVTRTFGDRTLFRNERVCVYEEILGPGQARSMHSHAPRLIIPLTGAHAAQRFPDGAAARTGSPRAAPLDAAHRVTRSATSHRSLLGHLRRAPDPGRRARAVRWTRGSPPLGRGQMTTHARRSEV